MGLLLSLLYPTFFEMAERKMSSFHIVTMATHRLITDGQGNYYRCTFDHALYRYVRQPRARHTACAGARVLREPARLRTFAYVIRMPDLYLK